jgi:diguanylate cyclase (GGDEF)-like protein/PAS domain S-box-containing protein
MLHVDARSLYEDRREPEPVSQLPLATSLGPALAAAQIGVWQLDMQTGLATWDSVTSRILGYEPDEQLTPRPLPVHPEDAADVAERLLVNSQGLGERDIEVRVVRPSGEIRWVRSTARALGGSIEPGRWVGGVVTDVTDRKLAENALRESQRQLSMLIDNLPGIAYRCMVEAPWRITFVSEGVERLTGWKPAEIMSFATGWAELVHADDVAAVERQVAEAVVSGRMFTMSYRIIDRWGSVRWLLEQGRAAYDADGKPTFLEGFIGDITEQKETEQSLLEARRHAERNAGRVHEVLENTSDCVYSLDSQWRFTYLNRRAREYFQNRPLLGESILEVFPGSRESVFRAAFDQAMLGKRTASVEGYLPSRDAWYDMNIVPAENGVTVFFRDITGRKQSEERVRWLANHDSLTQLPNRLLFQERLDELIACSRGSGGFALLLIDVDDFKQVNDTLGHDAGDALLCTFAERLREAARANDLVARLGGDEFAVLLHRVSHEEEVESAVERILARLREPHIHAGKVLDCSASIGAALFGAGSLTREELMKQADMAVYAAKAAGRANCKIFRPEMRSELQSRLSMVSLAGSALKNDRILPFYQPVVDLRTGQCAGFEALLRWEDPVRGFQTPDTIAAAFEDVSLAAEISDRMIDRVIEDMVSWRAAGIEFGHVAINAAAAEFRSERFAERLLERVHAASLPPETVQLEVTETVFLGRGADYVERALKTLSAAGVKIALDDFGTGYASLSHLKQFPVDIIKIDRSFVRELDTDGDAAAIVRAVVNLARSLDICVVAEGIEQPTQHGRLSRKGCDFGQGFFYSAAVPAREVGGLVRTLPLRHLTQRCRASIGGGMRSQWERA